MDTYITKTYGALYDFLREKIISMGGLISYPTPAGNFVVRLNGCSYHLDNSQLAATLELLPYTFGEVMAGERKRRC
jgi:hypothetical protein